MPNTARITINLTNHAPVSIDPDEWPVIASAKWHSGQNACQANEIARVCVRQHKDGRTLIYGYRDEGPGGAPLGYRGAYAGMLEDPGLDPRSISILIRDVCREFAPVPRKGGYDIGATMADECIGNLPPLTLD